MLESFYFKQLFDMVLEREIEIAKLKGADKSQLRILVRIKSNTSLALLGYYGFIGRSKNAGLMHAEWQRYMKRRQSNPELSEFVKGIFITGEKMFGISKGVKRWRGAQAELDELHELRNILKEDKDWRKELK